MIEAVVVGLFLLAFVEAAQGHATALNRSNTSSDQGAYLAFAEQSAKNFLFLDGSRGPAFPLSLLLVYDEGLDREAFFERAKTFTIFLTAGSWLGIWLLLRRLLPIAQGLVAWAVIGITCLLSYAPYAKAEGPYFAVNWFAFVLLGLALLKSTPRAALLAGAVTGVAYLSKNSARILLLAYALGALFELARQYLRAQGAPRARLRAVRSRWLAPLLVLLAFFTVCGPFLIASKLKYGHAFYNVNDFYAWYDSWAEVKRGTRAHEDRVGWPKMRDEDIPTARKYFETHSGQKIQNRLKKGWKRSLNGLQRRHMLSYAKLYLGVLVVFAALRYRQAAALAARYAPAVVFGASYLLGHSLLSAWFEPIASGPRVLAAGFPIFVFVCALAIFKLSETRGPGPKFLRHTAFATAVVAGLWLPADVSRAVETKVRSAKGGR